MLAVSGHMRWRGANGPWTSAPHIHIHSDGDDLSIKRLHLISIESLRTMKSCQVIIR
jgi:hypothetical protein